tara:strand:+ start:97 stop:267 length:171 start_codon:yes stop_codon:yes gene_type:complete
MKNDLDVKIWLCLDDIEHRLNKAIFLATGEPFKKDLKNLQEQLSNIKEIVSKRVDK